MRFNKITALFTANFGLIIADIALWIQDNFVGLLTVCLASVPTAWFSVKKYRLQLRRMELELERDFPEEEETQEDDTNKN